MQIDERIRQQLEASVLPLHFHELQFILFCRKLGFGTVEKLSIQNGVPTCAVNVTERVDFTKGEAIHPYACEYLKKEDSDETRNRAGRGRGRSGDAGRE